MWWSDEDVTRYAGLTPSWLRVLSAGSAFPRPRGSGEQRRWPAEEVLAWRARATADAAMASVTVADLRMTVWRLHGESVAAIARRAGTSGSVVARRTGRVATRIVAGVDPDLAWTWCRLRDAGADLAAIARRSHVSVTAITLVVEAWPARAASHRLLTPAQIQVAQEAWAAGADRSVVAAAAGVSTAILTRELTAGGIQLPVRWQRADIARHYGWGYSTPYQSRWEWPAPAGHTPAGRPWWWRADIETWAAARLVSCPECGALVDGLYAHRWRHQGS